MSSVRVGFGGVFCCFLHGNDLSDVRNSLMRSIVDIVQVSLGIYSVCEASHHIQLLVLMGICFKDSMMVNHHVSPTFGRISFILRSILSKS